MQQYETNPVEKQDIIRKKYNKALKNYNKKNKTKNNPKICMPPPAIKALCSENTFTKSQSMVEQKLVKTVTVKDGFVKGNIRSQTNPRLVYNVTIKLNNTKSGIVDTYCSCIFCENVDTKCKHVISALLHAA